MGWQSYGSPMEWVWEQFRHFFWVGLGAQSAELVSLGVPRDEGGSSGVPLFILQSYGPLKAAKV